MKKIVAIDTEFMNYTSYRPILSIVQLKQEGKEPIIYDVYKKRNETLLDLLEILLDNNIIKIIHSARNDIEAIFSRFNIVISNIFDTQIGYKFLKNKNDEISYSNLVEDICKKKIVKEKLIQKSNWLKRPLSEEQIFYAKQDVLYLHDIYYNMMSFFDKNEEKYRNFRNECLLLEDEKKYKFNPEKFWQKIRNGFINNINYELIKKLIILREKLAFKVNISRERVLKLKYIILFAETKDKNILLNNIHYKIDKDVFLNFLNKINN